MTREDFRRELGDAFDAISGSPSPALPDRVRGALVEDAPERRGPVWIVALAGTVIAVILVGILLVGNPLNRGPLTPGGSGQVSPSPCSGACPPPAPTPSPTPSVSVAPFICSERSAISAQTAPPPLSLIDAVRAAAHTDLGYDRLTIEFQNGQPGLIEFRPQASARFIRSPRGDTVTLAGKNGILIVIHTTDGHTAYSGPTDIKVASTAGLLEVREVEDFEGVVQWAMGLGVAPCYRASILTNPTRLVVDIKTS